MAKWILIIVLIASTISWAEGESQTKLGHEYDELVGWIIIAGAAISIVLWLVSRKPGKEQEFSSDQSNDFRAQETVIQDQDEEHVRSDVLEEEEQEAPAKLPRKILITLGGIAAFRMGSYIPIPGIDPAALHEVFAGADRTVFGGSYLAVSPKVGGAFSRVTVFSLGIMPYISGSVVILLLSGVIPYLRRLREGTVEQNGKFDLLTYGMTALICTMQALGIASFLESLRSPLSGMSIVIDPGWSFRLLVVLTVTSGTMLLVWIANQITVKGLTNGVALMILVGIVSELIPAITREYNAFLLSNKTFVQEILALVVLVALTALSIAMVSAKRCLPLQYLKQNSHNTRAGDWMPTIPLRVNTVGIIPIHIAASTMFFIMFIPSTLAEFFPTSEFMQEVAVAFSPGKTFGSVPYWIVYSLMIIFLTYLYTAVTFSTKDLVNRIKALRCFTWVIIKTRTSLLAECEVVPNRLLRYPHMRSLLNTRRVLNDPEIQFAV